MLRHGKLGINVRLKSRVGHDKILSRRNKVPLDIRENSATSNVRKADWPWQNNSSTTAEFRGILRLLTDNQRILLQEQRELSKRTQELAHRVGQVEASENCASTPFLQNLLASIEQQQQDDGGGSAIQRDYSHDLGSTFSVVVAGEFNAGEYHQF